MPGTTFLWMSTYHFVYIFNYETGNIIQLYKYNDVKSLSTLPEVSGTDSIKPRDLLDIEETTDRKYVQNIYRQGGIKRWNHTKPYGLNRQKRGGEQFVIEKIESRTVYVTPKNPGKSCALN